MYPYIIVNKLGIPDKDTMVFIQNICYVSYHPGGSYIKFTDGDGIYVEQTYAEVYARIVFKLPL